MQWSARIPDLSRVRWRHRVRIYQSTHGKSFHGLWEEGQARICDLPFPTDLHRGGGTLQRDPDHSHDPRALGLRVPGGQRGDLRYLQTESGHREAYVHEPEPPDRPDCLLHHGLVEVRWSPERRPHRVPDEPGPLSQDPLPSGDLCTNSLHREGLSRAAHRDGADVRLLRACHANGQVQPTEREVYGVLSAVQRGCGTQRRQREHRDDQNEKGDSIRRLVSYRVQGRYIFFRILVCYRKFLECYLKKTDLVTMFHWSQFLSRC